MKKMPPYMPPVRPVSPVPWMGPVRTLPPGTPGMPVRSVCGVLPDASGNVRLGALALAEYVGPEAIPPETVEWLRGMVAADVSGKADKATTLAGYGITDARISGGVITLGPDSIAPLTSHQSLAAYVNGGSYDSASRKILLKHDDATVAEIDAAAFVRDGMVSSAGVVNVPSDETPAGVADGDYLKVTFNTDAGKDPIYIPLAYVFDPANYYNKTSADGRFVAKEQGKGLSTNDYDATEKGKVSTALQPADIVDPAAAAETGKAADAKATGDALALRPTKAQLDAGWWSEWTILRTLNGVTTDVTSQVVQPEWGNNVWDTSQSVISPDTYDVPTEGSFDHEAGKLSWSGTTPNPEGGDDYNVDYTATRHLVAAPVPTKPSDIGAASTNDVRLTPVYSQTPTYGDDWTISPSGKFTEVLWINESGEYRWWLSFDEYPIDTDNRDPNATSVSAEDDGTVYTATRVRTDIIGYTLGTQTDKPLQPKGDYALLAQLYAAVRNLAPDFTAKTYAQNELCTYDGVFYKCELGYTADAQSDKPDADTTHWEAKKVSEIFLPLTGGAMEDRLYLGSEAYLYGEAGGGYMYDDNVPGNNKVALFANIISTANGNSTAYAKPADIGIPAFSTAKTYALNAKVVYSNALWNCTTAVSAAGAWNAANWTKICDLDTGAPSSGGTKLVTNGQVHTALDAKAPLASPAFTGMPTAPTPTAGDDSTKIATTAFVKAAVDAGGGAEYALIQASYEGSYSYSAKPTITVSDKTYAIQGGIANYLPICIPVKAGTDTDTISIDGGDYGDLFLSKNGVPINSLPRTLEAGDVLGIKFDDCLSPDTHIAMADGTVKRLDEVKVGDMVRSIDPETGELSSDRVTKVSQGAGKFRDIWTFEDGCTVTTVGRHRFWNADLGEFMYMEAWNMGESARSEGGKRVKLVDHVHELGEFPHATLFTEKWNNYFAGGLLAGNRRSARGKM